MSDPFLWVLATLGCLALQGLFAMTEMACISYPRVRLHYEAANGRQSARRLLKLLESPTRLFGTTLLMTNLGLQLGAECSRQLYESVGWNPDFAPITQAPLAILFAELGPLFAARRCPEPIARSLSPILNSVGVVLSPITALLGGFVNCITRWFGGGEQEGHLALTREELFRALEETGESKDAPIQRMVTQLFRLRYMVASDLMRPLSQLLILPGYFPVDQARQRLQERPCDRILIFSKHPKQITGVVRPADLLPLEGVARVSSVAQPPWVIPSDLSVLQLFEQFRHNSPSVGVIGGSNGEALGWITWDDLLQLLLPQEADEGMTPPFIDRTLPADLPIHTFNRLYSTQLEDHGGSLGDLVRDQLGHSPSVGDLVRYGGFEFRVQEASLKGPERIHVRTLD